jgi:hypothetical protein
VFSLAEAAPSKKEAEAHQQEKASHLGRQKLKRYLSYTRKSTVIYVYFLFI